MTADCALTLKSVFRVSKAQARIYNTGDTIRKKYGGGLGRRRDSGLGEKGTGLEEQSSLRPREKNGESVAHLQPRLWKASCPSPADITFVLLDGLFGQCQVGVGQARPLLQVTSPVLQRLQSVLRQLMSQGEI